MVEETVADIQTYSTTGTDSRGAREGFDRRLEELSALGVEEDLLRILKAEGYKALDQANRQQHPGAYRRALWAMMHWRAHQKRAL